MTGQPQILATEDLLLDIRTTLDALNARVAALNERLDAIQRSQTAWADLQVDLIVAPATVAPHSSSDTPVGAAGERARPVD